MIFPGLRQVLHGFAVKNFQTVEATAKRSLSRARSMSKVSSSLG
jgi:CheY-like chemotaxis protein